MKNLELRRVREEMGEAPVLADDKGGAEVVEVEQPEDEPIDILLQNHRSPLL